MQSNLLIETVKLCITIFTRYYNVTMKNNCMNMYNKKKCHLQDLSGMSFDLLLGHVNSWTDCLCQKATKKTIVLHLCEQLAHKTK